MSKKSNPLAAVPMRTLGSEFRVSAVSFGAMGMSEFYGPTEDQTSLSVLEAALDRGVTMFDTADMYGRGHNEQLLGRFIADNPTRRNRGELQIATKCGIVRDSTHHYRRSVDNSPAYIRAACDASLKRLQIDVIDLYYIHRIDKSVDIVDTMGALAALVAAGKVRYVGLSEVSAQTLAKAHQVHPVTAVQSEYSLWSRDVEEEILPACRQYNIGFVAYSPLGRGFLTGKIESVDSLSDNDFRRFNPRFQGDNFMRNRRLLDAVSTIAERHSITSAQVALAWVLSRGDDIVVIPGTRRLQYLQDNIAAASVTLSEADLGVLERVFHPSAIAGDRYPAEGMKGLNG